jgi:alanine-glyoxylate transaminase / serine-glyoxylate transaminase / serine-pyruvate transaminase
MMEKLRLMIPGPVDIFDETLDVMGKKIMPHLNEQFFEIYWETMDLLKIVFNTEHDIYMSTTSGSGMMDAAIGSMLYTGEKVLVIDTGPFTKRIVEIMHGYGLQVETQSFPIGYPADPDDVKKYLQEKSDFDLVVVVGNETGSGVVNPLRELGEVSHMFGLPLFVDGISMVGGMEFQFDEWDIDICCAVANKGMEAPPGLGIVAVSPRAWEVIDAKKDDRHHGWYNNLSMWKWYRYESEWRAYATTQATSNIRALHASLKNIIEVETLENHFARYLRAQKIVRKGLANLDFQMVAKDEWASPTVTIVWKPEEIDLREFLNFMRDKHRFLLTGGVWGLEEQTFRIGHMGLQSTDEYLIPFLLGVEDYMRIKGRNIPVGSSLIALEF